MDLSTEQVQEAQSLFQEESFGILQFATDDEFHIRGIEEANTIVTKIAEYEAQNAAIMTEARRRIAQNESKMAYLHWRYQDELKMFAFQELSKVTGKSKFVALPGGGRLQFRTLPETIEVDPDDGAKQLLDWTEKHLPDAVKITKSVVKSEVNTYWKHTGKIPPGCVYRPVEEKFYINTPAGAKD